MFVVAIGTVIWVNAGSLTPPAGPVAPTMKTLVEVEPRTAVNSLPGSATAVRVISLPGSYYLTADITGVSGKHGIEITTAGSVSLDLRGFRVTGVGGSLTGIQSAGEGAVSNGAISGWSTGVHVCQNAILKDLRVSGCNTGISVCRGQVTGCVAQQNQTGFLGFNALFRDCAATSNTATGFDISNGSSVMNCVASLNARGISASSGCTISNCTLHDNSINGIQVAVDCRVVGNHVDYSGADGILAYSAGNTIDGNSLTRNQMALRVTFDGNLIVRNTTHENAADYSIAPGNDDGEILTNPGSGFVATNPWANFAKRPPDCADGIQLRNETDIDCGGGTCPPCAAGQQCLVAGDCQSSVCTGSICQP
jgi:parallel beta-helix repeat protein